MRSFWSQIPMIRITLSVIAGIGAEIFVDSFFHSTVEVMWVMIGLLVLSLLIAIFIERSRNITLVYRLRVVNGIALSLFLISFEIGRAHV